jgi:hypothetical protein
MQSSSNSSSSGKCSWQSAWRLEQQSDGCLFGGCQCGLSSAEDELVASEVAWGWGAPVPLVDTCEMHTLQTTE